jgi:hypothetical protein
MILMPDKLKIVFLFCFLMNSIFFVESCPVNAVEFEEPAVRSTMYADKEFVRKQFVFSPYETIFLVLDFSNLEPGEYVLTTDWIRPGSVVEHQNRYSFDLELFTPAYRLFTWLRLWEEGPLKRVLTGSDFKRVFYGMWETKVYLNGKSITKQYFEIY